ncbi:hypothetical protein N473_25465 [Pseudoalteromonas luteoviolacea CPMOR-1]|uniref:Uncharacterized protein n=1 Tax=Pseudoalteromonas luteoviolacea CPMOR-1 TaxID=1365248 RepID=A0A167IU83_9GAMM|nr:hypothetical protein [Pseudoalteromonas luteoviolacea]KZN60075.1 hypothetical protein N473_25465 [Pseudoalteromonas luteoviolacea CPMOR-1]
MKKTVFALLSLVLIHNNAQAASYTEVSEIKAITIGTEGVRVKLRTMKQYENCSQKDWYFLDTNIKNFDTMYSGLLSHKATKEKIFLQLTGCDSSNKYPKINHVYLCDTTWCQ